MAEEVEAKRAALEALVSENAALKARLRGLTRAVQCGDHHLHVMSAPGAGWVEPPWGSRAPRRGAAAAAAREAAEAYVATEPHELPPKPWRAPSGGSGGGGGRGDGGGGGGASGGGGGAALLEEVSRQVGALPPERSASDVPEAVAREFGARFGAFVAAYKVGGRPLVRGGAPGA